MSNSPLGLGGLGSVLGMSQYEHEMYLQRQRQNAMQQMAAQQFYDPGWQALNQVAHNQQSEEARKKAEEVRAAVKKRKQQLLLMSRNYK